MNILKVKGAKMGKKYSGAVFFEVARKQRWILLQI